MALAGLTEAQRNDARVRALERDQDPIENLLNAGYARSPEEAQEIIAWATGGATTTGGAPNTLSESPADVGAYIQGGPAFTLPGTDSALSGLRALQGKGTSGLAALLDEGLDPRRREVENAMFERSAEDIRRESKDLFQKGLETTFGRGMGQSTVTQDYFMEPLERETLRAIGRARQDAIVGSGAESRADLSARLGALGQAFSSGTTGMQAEANVGMANDARGQAARQAGSQIATQTGLARLAREQQGDQFGRELASREALQRESFENAERIAESNRLTSGIAGGLGGLAQVFAPNLRNLASRVGFG